MARDEFWSQRASEPEQRVEVSVKKLLAPAELSSKCQSSRPFRSRRPRRSDAATLAVGMWRPVRYSANTRRAGKREKPGVLFSGAVVSCGICLVELALVSVRIFTVKKFRLGVRSFGAQTSHLLASFETPCKPSDAGRGMIFVGKIRAWCQP